MTTIAWDGKTLAADSLITENGLRVGYATKARAYRGLKYAVCGCLDKLNAFDSWVRGGMDGEAPAMSEEGSDEQSLAIIPVAGGILCRQGAKWDHMRCEFYATGSGREVALAILSAGGTAEDAVRTAISLDCYSGGPITAVR